MGDALIISSTEKSVNFLSEILSSASFETIVTMPSCAKARRVLSERPFDVVVINAPLKDENGESLARYIASNGISQVILIVKTEYYDEISAVTEDDGVLTVAKPLNKAMFWSALKLAKSASNQLVRMQKENNKLKQKIQDIRIIDRAKCVLISYLGMSEQDAHKYIEKQAMNTRETKIKVAEGILKTYEY